MRRFCDLGLRYPGSAEAAAALVAEARRLGYREVCLNVPVRSREDLATISSLRAAALGEGVLVGAELAAEGASKGAFHGLLARAAEAADVVAVAGGSLAVNKYAADAQRVDVLRAPYRGRWDSGVDKAVATAAAQNGVAIEVCFSDVLSVKGSRVPLLVALRELVRYASSYDATLVLSSGAHDRWGLRAPQDLAAFAACLGLRTEPALDTVSEAPERVAAAARARRDERFIAPGVRVV